MIITGMQIVCAAAIAIASMGITYQQVAEKIDEQKYPPIGKMINIDTHQLHIVSSGEQFKDRGPTVILDIGLNADCTSWANIQSEIAKFAYVCSYDRAGLGWSQESSEPRTAKNSVKDLRTLLKKAEIPLPYILVGHSFGGLIAQLYATTHPDEVAGMILVDSAHENMLDEVPEKMLQAWQSQSQKLWFVQSILVPLGILRWNERDAIKTKTININHPHDFIDMRVANICKSKYLRTFYNEMNSMSTSFEQVKNSSRSFGDIPLTVIIAGQLDDVSGYGSGNLNDYDEKTKQSFIAMCKRHKLEQSQRSTQGILIVAEKSSHRIPFEEPEIIIESVRQMYDKIKE